MPSCTSSRDVAEHIWPAFQLMPATIHSTAWSTSQSSNTTMADLPPSSSVTGRHCADALRITWLPTLLLPVKDNLSRPLWLLSAAPVSALPLTMFSTPAGRPRASAIWP
ncbi:hypothetical protein D9M71_440540 [compost metagenome]